MKLTYSSKFLLMSVPTQVFEIVFADVCISAYKFSRKEDINKGSHWSCSITKLFLKIS